jgi:holin-like protein
VNHFHKQLKIFTFIIQGGIEVKKWGLGILQVALLMAFSLLMDQMARALHLPVPGSILGMIVLFILLQTRVVKLRWIEIGAAWLLGELLLFFIPSAVGIMNYMPMLEQDGLQILFIVLLSTFLVMACTGLVATRIAKRKERHTG